MNQQGLQMLLLAASDALARNQMNAANDLLTQATQEIMGAEPASPGQSPDPGMLNQIAQSFAKAGNPAAAADILTHLAGRFPQDAPLHFNLGQMLRQADRYADAAAAFACVAELAPQDLEAHLLWAIESARSGELTTAIAVLGDLAQRHPEHHHARYLLAAYLELDNRLDEAREVASALIDEAPEHTGAQLVRAKLDRRAGDTDLAIKRLRGLPSLDADNPLAAGVEYELVRLFDADNQPDQAMAACERASAITLQQIPEARTRAAGYRYRLQKLLAQFNSEWVSSWSQTGDQNAFQGDNNQLPVFLVGFPRSGTTLLDQVLDAHPGFQVMEERNALIEVIAVADRLPGGYPSCLADLSPDGQQHLRDVYWQHVSQEITLDPDRRLVDKLPLSAVNLGLIQRIFPGAPIILALRHPLDTALSCYMQSFGVNDAMANFLTPEDTLATYDLVMQLVQRYRELFDLKLIEVRYEDVISDLRGQSDRLLSFLDAPFDEQVLAFYEHSQRRGQINTPSYHQVSQPIYTQARYRWRRYKPYVRAWAGAVNYWVEQYAYDIDGI